MPRASTSMPRAPDIRFRVEPGDVPAEKAARRLHLTPAAFEACKVRLFMRGFPRPDPDTGMYDLDAIDQWRRRRHPSLFSDLTAGGEGSTPAAPVKSFGELAREGERQRREAAKGRRHG